MCSPCHALMGTSPGSCTQMPHLLLHYPSDKASDPRSPPSPWTLPGTPYPELLVRTCHSTHLRPPRAWVTGGLWRRASSSSDLFLRQGPQRPRDTRPLHCRHWAREPLPCLRRGLHKVNARNTITATGHGRKDHFNRSSTRRAHTPRACVPRSQPPS